MRYWTLILILGISSCFTNSGDIADEGHAHASGDLTADYTRWTDRTELFVEFPLLVVGQTSRFAAHFTVLDGHQPVRQGKVSVSLVQGDKGIRNRVEIAASTGIFTPSLQPKRAGEYQLIFDLETPDFSDRITIDKVTVFENLETATASYLIEDDTDISFLKEQAWKIDFQTEVVSSEKIHEILNTSGIWRGSPSGLRTQVSNSTGIVEYATNNLAEGTEVKKGQLIMAVRSKGLTENNLEAEIDKAGHIYQNLKSEYDRKRQLYESKVIATAEMEDVENRFSVALTNYETLKSGYVSGAIQIKAPFNGFVRNLSVENGDYVNQGDELISFGSHQIRLLEIRVSPSLSSDLNRVNNIWYQAIPGLWSDMISTNGKLLSVGKEVSENDPLIPLLIEVNEPVSFPNGSFTQVQLAIGDSSEALVVSESALLEDYGDYSVIVQLGGESFERRPVRVGRKNGRKVEILSGLRLGERVVTKGAYQVKMASMSAQVPAHGHSH